VLSAFNRLRRMWSGPRFSDSGFSEQATLDARRERLMTSMACQAAALRAERMAQLERNETARIVADRERRAAAMSVPPHLPQRSVATQRTARAWRARANDVGASSPLMETTHELQGAVVISA
jgi:hypothetical protein